MPFKSNAEEIVHNTRDELLAAKRLVMTANGYNPADATCTAAEVYTLLMYRRQIAGASVEDVANLLDPPPTLQPVNE